MSESFRQALARFTEALARDVLSRIPAQPEDQLKGPVRKLLEDTGRQSAAATITLGRHLVFLHTFGERFVPEGETPGRVPRGRARCTKAIPEAPERYPEAFSYDENRKALYVGGGEIAPVEPAVWGFGVSGLAVVHS